MLEDLLRDVKVVATICLQFGDSGKGKISHWLAEQWADVNARGTGGANAGHTVIQDGHEVVYHLLPVGISYDSLGKVTVLGSGMVINPNELSRELDELIKSGGSYNGLRIDEDAGLVMPWNISRDKQRNRSQANGGIGSTGKGIGPAYADRAARIDLKMRDIMFPDRVREKLPELRLAYPEFASEMRDEKVIEGLRKLADRFKQYVTNTTPIIHEAIKNGRRVNLEGAQGTLLSVNHGVGRYITSSDCAINGTAAGVGISAGAVDMILGLVKFPFMTRVGAGPFPTEFGDKNSEEYCAAEIEGLPLHGMIDELESHRIPHEGNNYNIRDPEIVNLMNSSDPFLQGVGIRLSAGEYGATTGRPRRIGWTDAVAALYAININRPSDPNKLRLVITKVDSVIGLDEFKIGCGYEQQGGKATTTFSRDEMVQRSLVPHYRTYDGYIEEVGNIRDYKKLPLNLRVAMKDFENFTKSQIGVVSVGKSNEQTIVV